jgi:hypothetical protein
MDGHGRGQADTPEEVLSLAFVSLGGRPFRAENRGWSLSADAVFTLVFEIVH